MRYLPHTHEDIAAMLEVVGVKNLDELFQSLPADCRRQDDLNLPEAMTEWELDNHIHGLADTMATPPAYQVYLGAGSYEHYVPASVSYLLSRSEFVTSYTPYQPEISQGTLQAIFEYQTLTARLLGMEVANASIYDGASALAEAMLMSTRIARRKRIAVSALIHPAYRRVVKTYFEPTGYEVIELPYTDAGQTDLSSLASLEDLAAVAIQSPNFFGCIEDLATIKNTIEDEKTLMVVCFTEALAYGLLKSPGSQGAAIACGEGQSMGLPRSFGGPYLGMFASKMKYVRNMPGRLVGETKDLDGKRGFVLTLATREQHIRREKATSNICTNNSLCALGAAMFMASLGGTGIRQLAQLNHDKAEYLKQKMIAAGFKVPFSNPTFNEFVVGFPENFKKTYDRLIDQKIIAGLPLDTFYPELANHYLMCVTETKNREDLDSLVAEVSS